MPDLYFNRVPSLPATDDGSAKPLAEDLNTGSGDGEDITWDADVAGTDGVPAEAGPNAGPVMAGPEDEPEFAEADAAFFPASPETASAQGPGAQLQAAGLGTAGQPGLGATARGNGSGSAGGGNAAAETGRWFRPTKAEKEYVTIPPDEQDQQDDSAGADADLDLDSGDVAAPDPAEPEPEPAASAAPPAGADPEDTEDTAPAVPEPEPEPEPEPGPEPDPDPEDKAPAAPEPEPDPDPEDTAPAAQERELELEQEPEPLTGAAPHAADASAPAYPAEVRAQPADVRTPSYRDPRWAALAAGRAGSAVGRMSALLRPGPHQGGTGLASPHEGGTGLASPHEGGTGLASPPEGPVLAPLPDGPVIPEGPMSAPAPPDGIRSRVTRRTLLQAGLIGGAGVAALPLLALVGGGTRTDEQPASLAFSLNTNWLFGGQYREGSDSRFYDDSKFAPVTVPHTVIPLSWKNWDFPGWEQVWIYRRHFNGARLLNPHRPGNRILVDFDGVMVNAAVSINDQVVATHQGGYLPFSAELTGKVASGGNLLSVVVDSRCLPVPPVGVGQGPASVDFFQPGGIYRDVRLRVLPQVFLADLYARPADVLGAHPRVDVECTVDSAATAHAQGTLLVQLLDGQKQIAAQTTTVTTGSPGTSTARLSLTGFGPVSLWSPDSPKLYTVQATLNFPGIGSHMLSRRIGFREAAFRPEGFFLNGERLPLSGLNRHQLYPYAGMAMGARVQRKDAEILKNELNCNMVRCSHYPQSPAFLDACDELGLLVWEEAPGWHTVSSSPAWQDAVVRNVRDMVIRDRSRPSVIIWGTRLNETEDFPGLWAATRRAARELDGTRLSSGAMAFHQETGWNEDVFAYNDYRTENATGNIELKPPFPGLPYMVTEAVGVLAAKPQHFAWTDPPAWLARQAAMHGQAQSQARSRPGYAGLLAWAGFDYGSLLGPGPYDVKWAGVADGFRVPKPGAAIYQAQGDPAVRPVIVPVFFWEAAGPVPSPGPARTAMIASNCERLDVFIGGTRVASALPASGDPLYRGLVHPPFMVRLPKRIPRPAPELLIQGFVGGSVVARVRMSADPAGDALAMAADDAAISADGSDATRVVFRAIDTFGNQRRYGSGEVVLTLSGPATLVGDNPFAFGQYGGLGAVWIRSLAGQPGAITLTASHPLLGQAEVQVRSEPVQHGSELA
jgi:beta-galactosidase